MRKQIEDYILNNKIINEYFGKVDNEYRDEFRQYIYLIIFEMVELKYDKIKKLYNDDELGKFIIGIINNQLKSNTSSFHKMYRKSSIIDYYSYDKVNVSDDIRTDYIKKINYTNLIDKVKNLHPYHATLFMLKYVDGLTIKQISEKLHIKYTTVYASIRKTEDKLKKNKWIND